jgi:hypothetical protein
MSAALTANAMLAQEARGLLTRLALLQPFALQMPMVAAAAVSPAAQAAVETHLITGRRKLRAMVKAYLAWLGSEEGRSASAAEGQRRLTLLRLRFNSITSQFDIFADVLSQRAEHRSGVWVSGLDVVAAEALKIPGPSYEVPPVICYLDRGHGAAIRRARTRLPGGEQNPVAIIRVPRERMVGAGIASSLFHEVGHQGASLLGLVDSLRPVLQRRQRLETARLAAWRLWERWISEIVADFWSVARVGITSTVGLLAVVSLPRVFVFRAEPDDPHPMPWIRVKLSCALGDALYPHPQWARLARLWESFYPVDSLADPTRTLLADVEATMPEFVGLVMNHRPERLGGRSLGEVFRFEPIRPDRLRDQYGQWQLSGRAMKHMIDAPPSLVFAVVGQARSEGRITPEEEAKTLEQLLSYWAVRETLQMLSHVTRRPRLEATAAA